MGMMSWPTHRKKKTPLSKSHRKTPTQDDFCSGLGENQNLTDAVTLNATTNYNTIYCNATITITKHSHLAHKSIGPVKSVTSLQ